MIVAAPAIAWAVGWPLGFGAANAAMVYSFAAIIAMSLLVFFSAARVEPRLSPLLLIGAGAIGAAGFINILPQLALTSALIGAYGFVGLIPRWQVWWSAGLFAALLIALVLPFGVSSQTGAGFFLRVVVTDAAAQILNMFGVTFLSAHDVLIFENSLARVDAPCSGLKSLFTGTAFFLAASMVLRRRLSPRWLGAYGVFLLLILTGNVARIVILVTLIESYDARALAELFHIPLGILFFVLSCAAGVWFLTFVQAQASDDASKKSPHLMPLHQTFAASLLPLAAISLALIIAPADGAARSGAPSLAAPMLGEFNPLDLTPAEKRFYASHADTSARKWRFQSNGLSGSVLMVRSSALTAMHAPEICFEANGFQINAMKTHEAPGRSWRELSVGKPALSAVYWMQSRNTITDSFTTRLNRYALHGENDWVMVTILFDYGPDFGMKKTSGLLKSLEQHVAGQVGEEREYVLK